MKMMYGKNALVIGGSMAGMLAARVLSDYFDQVTIIERDPVRDEAETRKGQPHTRHLHALLVHGHQILERFFPDLTAGLRTSGNDELDMALSMRWYCFGGYRTRFEFGWRGLITSRPFLEWQIRRRVLALPNVQLRSGYSVLHLLATEDNKQITGVQLTTREAKDQVEPLLADLVVDTSGRGSQSPKWLKELGYAKPEENTVTCGTGYTTRLYERNPDEPGGKDWVFVTPEPPKSYRMGGAFPIEHNRWIVSVGGWHGDHCPTDEEGFINFAKSLPAPDIYTIISRNTPLTEISAYKFPASLRRHYEKLNHFPDGYLVLGDAICSFNPLYGQGMTSAALQVTELDKLLQQSKGDLRGIARPYFKHIAKIIDISWQTAVGEDFRFPQTQGKKTPGTDFINAYVAKVHRATHHDPVVGDAFLKVMNLMEPPTSLFHPRILWRVMRPFRKATATARQQTADLANA